jgi:hypothetical protein
MTPTIEADSNYPGMYRIRADDGSLSDMVNLARAKDALRGSAAGKPRRTVRRAAAPDTGPPPIVIVAVPCFDAEGARACTDRGPLFDARIGDRVVVQRTLQPLLDACRVLIAEGVDAKTRVVMRHEGRADDALRARVGVAAGLTVSEPSHGRQMPRFGRYQPVPQTIAGISPSPPIEAPGAEHVPEPQSQKSS